MLPGVVRQADILPSWLGKVKAGNALPISGRAIVSRLVELTDAEFSVRHQARKMLFAPSYRLPDLSEATNRRPFPSRRAAASPLCRRQIIGCRTMDSPIPSSALRRGDFACQNGSKTFSISPFIDPNTAIFNTNFKSAVRHNRRDDLSKTTMVQNFTAFDREVESAWAIIRSSAHISYPSSMASRSNLIPRA